MVFRRKHKDRERGQVLILCAVFMVILLLFVGLAVDFGLAYVTKARLGKAVDAAALTGAKALVQGQTQATAIAKSSFAMNYHTSDRDVTAPAVIVAYSTDATTGNTLMNVHATATTRTFFLGLLPSFSTLNISAAAQATRARVIMTLVLDTSGSMKNNGGWSALPPDVNEFVLNFDNTLDSIAMVHFASKVTVDVPMRTGGFVAPIQSATSGMNKAFFSGATYSDGGLQQAIIQNSSLTLPGNVVKVVVFFTDGHANTIQNSLLCNGPNDVLNSSVGVLWNFGGFDTGSSDVAFLDPGTGVQRCDISRSTCCTATFPAASQGGSQTSISQAHIQTEAEYRSIAAANTMRTQNTVVYAIGLGNDVNADFLRRVANDPASSTFDSTKPVGEADFAPTADDLRAIFQRLAAKILLRLTQ